jgi:uncharacterized membrane protein YphA (DoxX/SURF4 family)
MLADAIAALALRTPTTSTVLGLVSLVTGVLLLLGLWTPAAAVGAAAIGIWHAVSGPSNPSLYLLLALLGAALALLGPGGWSIDARLFGWKRLEIRNGGSNTQTTREDKTDAPPV